MQQKPGPHYTQQSLQSLVDELHKLQIYPHLSEIILYKFSKTFNRNEYKQQNLNYKLFNNISRTNGKYLVIKFQDVLRSRTLQVSKLLRSFLLICYIFYTTCSSHYCILRCTRYDRKVSSVRG